jgi:hypothetical protein
MYAFNCKNPYLALCVRMHTVLHSSPILHVNCLFFQAIGPTPPLSTLDSPP